VSVCLAQMTARIVSSAPDGRPQTLEIVFEEPLESSSYLFVVWKGNRFEPLEFGPPGQSLRFGAVDLGQILTRTALEAF
jgi:hypothetical protein